MLSHAFIMFIFCMLSFVNHSLSYSFNNGLFLFTLRLQYFTTATFGSKEFHWNPSFIVVIASGILFGTVLGKRA